MIPLALFASEPTVTGNFLIDVFLGILGVIGIVGIIGGASAYFYKGRADALIALQEKEINVIRENSKALTDQNVSLKEERTKLYSDIKRMGQEIKTLRSLIEQPKQVQKLAEAMATQHGEVIDKLTAIAEGLVNQSTDKK